MLPGFVLVEQKGTGIRGARGEARAIVTARGSRAGPPEAWRWWGGAGLTCLLVCVARIELWDAGALHTGRGQFPGVSEQRWRALNHA